MKEKGAHHRGRHCQRAHRVRSVSVVVRPELGRHNWSRFGILFPDGDSSVEAANRESIETHLKTLAVLVLGGNADFEPAPRCASLAAECVRDMRGGFLQSHFAGVSRSKARRQVCYVGRIKAILMQVCTGEFIEFPKLHPGQKIPIRMGESRCRRDPAEK
jgi:hypothetical protein